MIYSQRKSFSIWLNFSVQSKHAQCCKIFSGNYLLPKQMQPKWHIIFSTKKKKSDIIALMCFVFANQLQTTQFCSSEETKLVHWTHQSKTKWNNLSKPTNFGTTVFSHQSHHPPKIHHVRPFISPVTHPSQTPSFKTQPPQMTAPP